MLTHAQSGADLRGTITDPSGALVAGASVALVGAKDYTAKSDGQGRYHLSSVAPGKYTLKVMAQGFAPFGEPLELTSESRITSNVSLKIAVSEHMEINLKGDVVSTEPDRNLSAITLSGEELEALPDDPDALLQMLRLMAGGGSARDLSLQVDGFPHGGRLPPKRAIQSIRINSNPFAAEYSEPGRNRIEITTKPGTDRFHGEFTANFNDESLNARHPFAPLRAPSQSRDYSGYLNGPIIQNRWDFLIYAGVWERDANSVINARVLAPDALQARPFATTVLTPTRVKNLSLHTSYVLTKNQTVSVGYSHASDAMHNQGLQSGFDLPERAFNNSSRDDSLRLSLTSTLNNRALNQARLQLRRYNLAAVSVSAAPAILVFEAFNSGGNQGSLETRLASQTLHASDNLSFTYKKHTFKFGARINAAHLNSGDRSNFGGTFAFGTDFERDASGSIALGADRQPVTITPLELYRRTVLGLPGYTPSQFSISRGDPFAGLTQWETGWFAQDDWRLADRLTLSYGLRHEFQTHLADKLNFAPRISLAWSPDKQRKSVVRIGTGIFYDNLDAGITLDTIRHDGRHQQQFVVAHPPSLTDLAADLTAATARLQSLRTKSRDLKAPYSIISVISYERQLARQLFGSVGYTWQRGVHLLRSRNINAPLVTLDSVNSPDGRPFPDLGPILQFESTGASTHHELRVGLRTRLSRRLALFGNYTLASTRSDTDGAYASPANPYDLSTEFGRAGFDQRHQLWAGGSAALPWGIRLNPFIFVSSGKPFNITNGRDNNGDTLFTDRPALARRNDPGAVVTRFGAFNPNPGSGKRIIPRNFGQGPGQVSVNVSFSKTFGFNLPTATRTAGSRQAGQRDPVGASNWHAPGREDAASETHQFYLTMGAEAQNLFNHTNFGGFNGVLTSPFFGRANRALNARQITLMLRLGF